MSVPSTFKIKIFLNIYEHVKIWREWQALRALGGFLALYPCGVSHLAVPELNPFTVKDM